MQKISAKAILLTSITRTRFFIMRHVSSSNSENHRYHTDGSQVLSLNYMHDDNF